jgi:hypothetical protein
MRMSACLVILLALVDVASEIPTEIEVWALH